MSRQRIFEQFQEKPGSRPLAVIPVGGYAEAEHETLFVTQIDLYSDLNIVSISLMLGVEHPEHKWRDMGRPGHPFMAMTMSDDLGTEYAAMPSHGGGGRYRYDFNCKTLPPIPMNAKEVTLLLSKLSWNADAPQRFYAEGETPMPDWSITVDLSNKVTPRPMTEIGSDEP